MLQEGEKPLPRIRTFRTDATEFMQERKVSQLDAASSAYISQQNAAATHTKKFPKKIIAALLGVLVLGGGVVIVRSLFSPAEEITPPATTTPLAQKFISADQERAIQFASTNPGSLIAAIGQERDRALRAGSIVQLNIALTTKEFGMALGWAPPASLWESATPQFNALIVQSGLPADFAVIIPMYTFEQTLSALLLWEPTMWFDWKLLILPEHIKNIEQFTFQDDIIRNNDSRVLADKNGKVILGYTIFNKKFLVISTSRESLSLILEKLIAVPPQID